jgi:hypothetical protein
MLWEILHGKSWSSMNTSIISESPAGINEAAKHSFQVDVKCGEAMLMVFDRTFAPVGEARHNAVDADGDISVMDNGRVAGSDGLELWWRWNCYRCWK